MNDPLFSASARILPPAPCRGVKICCGGPRPATVVFPRSCLASVFSMSSVAPSKAMYGARMECGVDWMTQGKALALGSQEADQGYTDNEIDVARVG